MQRSVVEKFLSESRCFPKGQLMLYFKLLEKFQIALPLGEEHLLVHCRYVLYTGHSRHSKHIQILCMFFVVWFLLSKIACHMNLDFL